MHSFKVLLTIGLISFALLAGCSLLREPGSVIECHSNKSDQQCACMMVPKRSTFEGLTPPVKRPFWSWQKDTQLAVLKV